MHAAANDPSSWNEVLFYGVSASSVRSDIDQITGIQTGKMGFRSPETGFVRAVSEVTGGGNSGGYFDCSCSGGGGDGEAYCLIVVAVLMILFAVVWAIVMLAFAIMTAGGFVKRRYRTKLVMEKQNKEFVAKLAILSFRKGGVSNFHSGYQPYDDWVDEAFNLYVRKKYIRQVAFFFGYIWGAVEIIFKLTNIFDPTFHYDLWPLRFVMIAIMLPLLLYSPILEMTIRSAFSRGKEPVERLILEYPAYSPDTRMGFSSTPEVDDRTPQSVADEDDSYGFGNQ